VLALAPYAVAGEGALEWAIPVLDPTDRVRGIFVASGGASHEPRWRGLPSPGPRWSGIVERLQRSNDSSSTSVPRDTRPVRGPVRVFPYDSGIAYVQTTYAVRGDGVPFAQRVAVLHGDSVSSGATLADAIGVAVPEVPHAPSTPAEFRARVEGLYNEMREAMRRGDWRAFGMAYEELGRVLRTTTP
jgi:hypothetical protein